MKQAIAYYLIPFPDFDYRPLVEACGCALYVQTNTQIIVGGTSEAIGRLSIDLGFAPTGISYKK